MLLEERSSPGAVLLNAQVLERIVGDLEVEEAVVAPVGAPGVPHDPVLDVLVVHAPSYN